MRRALALLAATLALSASPAGAGEPLDVDLARLGPPAREVWLATLPCQTVAACSQQEVDDAEVMAGDARVRFGRLVTDLAMAFTSNLGQLAGTTGYNGFQLDLELSYTQVSAEQIGGETTTFPASPVDPATPAGGPRPYWTTRSEQPSGLLVPSVHVRKGLPYGFELGGRFSYLAQSSYFAGQVEAKWAFVEGYKDYPDVALRVAWTKVLGPPELNLSTTELGLLASKRFGVGGVASLTPYLGLRLTRLDASTRPLAYRADDLPAGPTPPAEADLWYAAFPSVTSTLYRTTAGVRLTSFTVSMALELTYFGDGAQGEEAPAVGQYPRYTVPASLSGAFKFGFHF